MFFAVLGAAAASAGTITFTETITTSGSLDGTGFTNQLVTLTLTGNTSSITNPSSGLYELIGAASVSVSGIGTDTFTDTMEAFDNQSLNWAGIADETTGGIVVLLTTNAAFGSYALNTSIGPYSGGSLGNPGTSFPTALETFTITGALNVDHPSAFTASTAGAPEPGTFMMLGAGIGLVLFGRRLVR